jgi:molybdopterin/thiamine biosynthesis adenylyltransferase
MDDAALLRYSRQILLPAIDLEGQEQLGASTVLVLGLGGLGAPAALYLAGAGVGTLLLADDDPIDLSNLPRQVLYSEGDLGEKKSVAAKARLTAQNHAITLEALPRLTGAALREAVTRADLVLDCTDHFAIRDELNGVCLATGTRWVSAAALRTAGQLMAFDPRDGQSPCYRCLWPELPEQDGDACAEAGVLGPVVGLLGVLQALEAVKWLTGHTPSSLGAVLSFEGLSLELHRFALKRRAQCSACGSKR